MGQQMLHHPHYCPSCGRALWVESEEGPPVDKTLKFKPGDVTSDPLFWSCPFDGFFMPMWDFTSPLYAVSIDWLRTQDHTLTTEGPVAYPGGKNGWYRTTCSCGGSSLVANWWGSTEKSSQKAAREHQLAWARKLAGVRA